MGFIDASCSDDDVLTYETPEQPTYQSSDFIRTPTTTSYTTNTGYTAINYSSPPVTPPEVPTDRGVDPSQFRAIGDEMWEKALKQI